jgi:hypothetical protein
MTGPKSPKSLDDIHILPPGTPMVLTKKGKKLVDAYLGKLASRATSGRPILLSDIARVFAVAEKAFAEGKDAAAIEAACVAFVETITVDTKAPAPRTP